MLLFKLTTHSHNTQLLVQNAVDSDDDDYSNSTNCLVSKYILFTSRVTTHAAVVRNPPFPRAPSTNGGLWRTFRNQTGSDASGTNAETILLATNIIYCIMFWDTLVV